MVSCGKKRTVTPWQIGEKEHKNKTNQKTKRGQNKTAQNGGWARVPSM